MDSERGRNDDHTYSMSEDQLISAYVTGLDKEYESRSRTHARQKFSKRCHNCGIALWIRHLKNYTLSDPDILSVIQRWIHPRPVSNENIICCECWDLVTEHINNPASVLTTTVGHKSVCIACGRSLRAIPNGLQCQLKGDTHTNACIRYLIAKDIYPRTLTGSERTCAACHRRAYRAAIRVIEATTNAAKTPHQQSDNETHSNAEEQNTPSEGQTIPSEVPVKPPEEKLNVPRRIYLPHYAKAPDTQESCCFPNCDNEQKLTITETLRVRIFCDYNYYVPRNCTTCEHHNKRSSWKLLLDVLKNPERRFSAAEIEDIASLIKS